MIERQHEAFDATFRSEWRTPELRRVRASAAENNAGGALPDAEGTS